MTPAYNELIAAVRQEGEAIVAAGKLGLDVDVPTCGEWTMRELLLHVGRVYLRAATLVSERSTTQQDYPPEPGADVEPAEYLADSLDEVVEALASCEPATPVWNWSEESGTAAFWARRMTHESTVHRYDAQRAHSLAQPVDADLAHDGLDELIDVILPRVFSRDGIELPTATLLLTATDDGSWPIRLGPDGFERLELAKEPDVSVTATSSALMLAAYNRMPWSSLQVEGDAAPLESWADRVRF